MADSELQNLTTETAPSGDDMLYIVNDPAGAPGSRSIALSTLLGALPSAFTIGTAAGVLNLQPVASSEVVVNENSVDGDFRVESNTYANMFVLDAGLDAMQIGTAVAGTIADFRATSIVFNEAGADMDFRVESDTNENALFLDGATGYLGLGTNVPSVRLEIRGQTNTERFNIYSAGNTGVGTALVRLGVARNTIASPAAVQTDDVLGFFQFAGHDGTDWQRSAWLYAAAAENYDSTHRGSYFVLSTTPVGSTAIAEALRIQSDQTLKLSSANSWTANGTAVVALTNLGPAGIGTATVNSWLTVTKNDGTVMYIPAWT